MNKKTYSDLAKAAALMAAGGGLVVGAQVISGQFSQQTNTNIPDNIADFLQQTPQPLSNAFVGSTAAKLSQDANTLAREQEALRVQQIKAQNEAVYALHIKPLMDLLTEMPVSENHNQFVVTAGKNAKTASYTVDYARLFESVGPHKYAFPTGELISKDEATNIHVYKEGVLHLRNTFVINVAEDGLSISTSNGFAEHKTQYATLEELYKGIGENLRILAPSRIADFAALEQKPAQVQATMLTYSALTP